MSVHNMGVGNGYSAPYAASPGGGMGTVGYDTKMGGSFTGGPVRSDTGSFKQSDRNMEARSIGGGGGSINQPGSLNGPTEPAAMNSPLMGSGAAGVGAGGGPSPTGQLSQDMTMNSGNSGAGGNNDSLDAYRAKALYSCELVIHYICYGYVPE